MVANPILSLSNLVIGYNEPLVEPISLEVGEGEVIAILGVSGIGKTTLLRTIAGLVPPIKGSYRLKVDKKGGLGYIPQNLGLVRHASVANNVGLGAGVRLEWTMFSERRKRTEDALKAVGLTEKSSEPVRRLSGGQKRRVATARTLAQRPQLILADEFLSELDENNASAVMEAVHPLVVHGSSLIMVEHNPKYVIRYASRVWWFHDGAFTDLSAEEWEKFNPTGGEEA